MKGRSVDPHLPALKGFLWLEICALVQCIKMGESDAAFLSGGRILAALGIFFSYPSVHPTKIAGYSNSHGPMDIDIDMLILID